MAGVKILSVRFDADDLAILDEYAHSRGLNRSDALREALRVAAQAEGSGSTPLPARDEPLSWPASDELRLEETRRILLEQARAGSATAAAALERSLRRAAAPPPPPDVDPVPMDPADAERERVFAELDALAEAKRRRR